MAEKDPKYIKELSERREENPAEFEKQKEMYDAARQKETEDQGYSAMETIKRLGKKALGMKKGGCVKMAKGGSVSSASKRADGCAVKGKTKGRMV